MHSFGKFDDLFFNNLSTSLNLWYIGLWLFSCRHCVNQLRGLISFRDWIRGINKNIVERISVKKIKNYAKGGSWCNNKVYLLADYVFYAHFVCVWREPKTIFQSEEIVFWKEHLAVKKWMSIVIYFIINNDEIFKMIFFFF